MFALKSVMKEKRYITALSKPSAITKLQNISLLDKPAGSTVTLTADTQLIVS